MADVTSKKKLILVAFALLFSLTSFAQKKEKLTSFSTKFPAYLVDLEGFLTANDNSKLKLVSRNFSKEFDAFSQEEKVTIIKISNKMLGKRLRANPHFLRFLSAIISVKNSNKGDSLLLEWLNIFEETLDRNTTNKLMLFCVFTNDLFNNNVLRSSKAAEWRISNTDFYFSYEMNAPVIIFEYPFELSCNSDYGSYTIVNTTGKYNFISNEWFGRDGIINWETHGYSKDSVFAEISLYKIDTRKSEIIADSSIFYNMYDLKTPIYGRVVNKITKGKQANRYPRFTSYSKEVELEEIFANIDYRGGYKLQGKDFVADGGDFAEAKIVFKRNGEDVFVANATRFSIGSDRIISQEAGVKIFFENDSIYHANIHFKYIDSKRQLQLYRDATGLSSATMLNTYHNLTMDFELLEWNIDTDIITFGSLPGTAVSQVYFESVARYDSALYIMLGGIDAIHPIFLIKNYVRDRQMEANEEIDVVALARYAGFPLHQVKDILIRLSRYGFVFYDFGVDRITVLPKLYNYVYAVSEVGDYDVISFNSVVRPKDYINPGKHLVNATLDLETKDLDIIGIKNIEVSKERGVYLNPVDGKVVIRKNRDFIFNGQILAGKGRLNLFGREFAFNYDNFKVDLNYIDSAQFSVPVHPIQKDIYGNALLTPIRTVIEAVKGELKIDDPSNKSGIRKDSFPQYPIFRSFEDSYTYYDRRSICGGVYNRDEFSFHLQPFEIDSLDNYTGKGLSFAGTFQSAGIFPTFEDTLTLKDDYSLGFTRKTPDDGFVLYGGKGKYYNDIYLSNSGLKGSGDLEYITSKSSANEILFFPDSTNLYTQSFEIGEVSLGIEFPEVANTDTYVHFEPYNDRMQIKKIKNEFTFYKSQANFNGNLLLRPTGLTGGGVMSLDEAQVSADLFTYNANWFGSDTASLQVFKEGGSLAFKANDLKTHIDLVMREGIFNSNGPGSYVELPANQYISYIDRLKWVMDESLTLGDEFGNGEGSKFVSIHPSQDSLSFLAKTAFYSLKDYIIHAAGVNDILVADAIIYPDSGIVTITKDALIETLYGAKIVADDLMEYHTFTNANVDIKSAYNYIASGNYSYRDAMNNEQQIFFKEIRVVDTITLARGDVDQNEIFHIDSKFDFKGSVDLIADQKNLTFDGYFMANHNCSLLEKEWVKFRSNIDPQDIKFVLDEDMYNEADEVLSSALVMSFDSTNFYSTFLSKKKRVPLDLSIFSASYNLEYDKKRFAYIVGGPDTLSNYYTLYDKTCATFCEGNIDLNLNLGQVKTELVGNANHKMYSGKTELGGFLMLDFFFSEEAMIHMASALYDSKDEELFEYDDNFSKNLSRVVGHKRAEMLLLDLQLTDEYPEFPVEMEHSIVFAKTNFRWDDENKAYVFKGPIAVHSMMGKHLNSTHSGLIIIEKGPNSDILTFYLDTDYDYKYYFQYRNGVMSSWSDNPDFEIAINEISNDKRRSERVRGAPAYRYMFVSEEVAERSLRKLIKKY